MLEKTPESPLDRREIKPAKLKGNQSWILLGRTDAEAEAPVFWSSDENSWLIGKVSDTGKDRAEGEEGIRGWNDWVASPMQWTWTGANFRRWWETQRPGVLKSMRLQSNTTGQLNHGNNVTKCMISRYRNVVTSRFFFLKIPKPLQWNIAEIYISFIDRWAPIFLRPCREEKQDP